MACLDVYNCGCVVMLCSAYLFREDLLKSFLCDRIGGGGQLIGGGGQRDLLERQLLRLQGEGVALHLVRVCLSYRLCV